jgi:hypothetical protein
VVLRAKTLRAVLLKRISSFESLTEGVQTAQMYIEVRFHQVLFISNTLKTLDLQLHQLRYRRHEKSFANLCRPWHTSHKERYLANNVFIEQDIAKKKKRASQTWLSDRLG